MAKSSKVAAKIRKRRKRRRNPESEPLVPVPADAGAATELAYTVGAGFAGYAATKFLTRIAHQQALKRWPQHAKHIAAGASVVSAGGVWAASRYWDKIAEHHEAMVLGAGIGAVQTLVQTYLPAYGWIVGDLEEAPKRSVASVVREDELARLLDDNDLEVVSLDEPARPSQLGAAPAPASSVDDLLADLPSEWTVA